VSLGQFIVEHAWELIGLVGLIFCSALFSGAETALFSLSRVELLRLGRDGQRAGRMVVSLMRRPRRLLMVLLLGNQLANVAFFAVSASLVLRLQLAMTVGPWWDVVLLLSPLLVIILLGEVCPKNLAISSPPVFARLTAGPLSLLVRVLGPVQTALNFFLIDPLTRLSVPSRHVPTALTPAELADLLELSGRRGMITESESTWLQEVIGLSRLKVCDIMVPRVDMVAYDIESPADGLVELFRKTGLVKIPVYRGDLDNTLGVVHAKHLLLAPQTVLTKLVRDVPYVPETGTVDKLLLRFRQTKTQMAIVVDEYGGTAGLVTLEDAMEEIVGQIAAPGEELTDPVRRVGENEYLLDADLAIHEWSDLFESPLSFERISTIGGLVVSLLGRVPIAGDVATYLNLEFTVESVHRRRVRQLRLRLREDTMC